MNFSIVSKQNMGVVVFLLLVIIISQAHLLDFLFYTTLGRAFFILLLLIVGYLNKILGVFTVLLAILLINNRENHFQYFEGITDMANASSSSSSSSDSVVKDLSVKDPSSNIVLDTVISEKTIDLVKDPSGNIATEGFDILGTENNLKRGKKSNSIPVSNSIRNSENVDPYYTSSFDNSYSFL
jgi:hypothetical protein